jgi:hypothetical protein
VAYYNLMSGELAIRWLPCLLKLGRYEVQSGMLTFHFFPSSFNQTQKKSNSFLPQLMKPKRNLISFLSR